MIRTQKHIGSTLDSFLEEEGIKDIVYTEADKKVSGIDREKLLDSIGNFTWDFGQQFFVETKHGNYVWSDPDYYGDNSFTKFEGSYKKWIKQTTAPYGRDKGTHLLRSYCGDQIVLK